MTIYAGMDSRKTSEDAAATVWSVLHETIQHLVAPLKGQRGNADASRVLGNQVLQQLLIRCHGPPIQHAPAGKASKQ